jgi:hypothetical protein
MFTNFYFVGEITFKNSPQMFQKYVGNITGALYNNTIVTQRLLNNEYSFTLLLPIIQEKILPVFATASIFKCWHYMRNGRMQHNSAPLKHVPP